MGAKNEKELGASISLLRTRAGLTQDELAKISGVSQRTISLLENGKSGTITSLIKVIRGLKSEINLTNIISEVNFTDFLE